MEVVNVSLLILGRDFGRVQVDRMESVLDL